MKTNKRIITHEQKRCPVCEKNLINLDAVNLVDANTTGITEKNYEKIILEINSHLNEANDMLSQICELLNQIDDISFDKPIVIGLIEIENEDQLLDKKTEIEAVVRTYEHCLKLIEDYKNWYDNTNGGSNE